MQMYADLCGVGFGCQIYLQALMENQHILLEQVLSPGMFVRLNPREYLRMNCGYIHGGCGPLQIWTRFLKSFHFDFLLVGSHT